MWWKTSLVVLGASLALACGSADGGDEGGASGGQDVPVAPTPDPFGNVQSAPMPVAMPPGSGPTGAAGGVAPAPTTMTPPPPAPAPVEPPPATPVPRPAGGAPYEGAVPSAGCGVPWTADDATPALLWKAQEARRTIQVAGAARDYLVSVPTSYDPNVAYPLIFGFHGSNGNAEELRWYVNMEIAADQNAVFIYPAGLLTPQGTTGWHITGPADEDLALVDALVDKYQAELCIDTGRVLAYGHSYGGVMSNAVGCYRGTTFRAIAPIAGGLQMFGGACSGQVAALIMHNPMDVVTPYVQAIEACNYWRADNGCSDQHMPYDHMSTVNVTERDVAPPVFREYVGCDPARPVVHVDYNWKERGPMDPQLERFHNPPPWTGEVLWKFFTRLPPSP